jgi:hypothetical protein
LTPAAQKRMDIRYGLIHPLPGKAPVRATKKAARRRR